MKPNYLHGNSNIKLPININVGDYLLNNIIHYGETVAFKNVVTDTTLTYKQLSQQAMNFAVSLTHHGVRKGDVVALCSENRPEFWSAFLGVICTGAVFTPYNPGYGMDEMENVINISKPKYIICSPTALEVHEETFKALNIMIIVFGEKRYENITLYDELVIPNDVTDNDVTTAIFKNNRLQRNVVSDEFKVCDVRSNDLIIIMYSSGTTGQPKGVMLEQCNVLSSTCMQVLIHTGPRILLLTPWFHVMGLMGTMIGVSTGISFYLLPRFDVDLYLKTIQDYKINQLMTVPPMLVAISKSSANYDLNSVNRIVCGAAPLHRETIEVIHNKFPNCPGVLQGYGMTECTLAITTDDYVDGKLVKVGTVGKVIDGTTIKIVDIETREVLGAHEMGEICTKGVTTMRGYINRDKGEDFDDEGFFKTGDIGYYDEDKYLYVTDRLKEVIKYMGHQVAPAEIEAVLLQHAAVRDVGVVGLPDEAAGELPLAFVAVQPDKTVTDEELIEFVADKLSNPNRLRGGVRFVPEIPKNPSGKILRKDLRVLAKDGKSIA